MRFTGLFALASLASLPLTSPLAHACIHPASADPVPPQLDGLEIGVYYDGANQVLSYAPTISARGDSTALAMVTAVPGVPSRYNAGETGTFADIRRFLTPQNGGVNLESEETRFLTETQRMELRFNRRLSSAPTRFRR